MRRHLFLLGSKGANRLHCWTHPTADMAFRGNSAREARELAREALLRRMERVLERPLTPEEVRLILLVETVREELEGGRRVA